MTPEEALRILPLCNDLHPDIVGALAVRAGVCDEYLVEISAVTIVPFENDSNHNHGGKNIMEPERFFKSIIDDINSSNMPRDKHPKEIQRVLGKIASTIEV